MGVRDKKKAPTPGVPGAGAVYDSESRGERAGERLTAGS